MHLPQQERVGLGGSAELDTTLLGPRCTGLHQRHCRAAGVPPTSHAPPAVLPRVLAAAASCTAHNCKAEWQKGVVSLSGVSP